MVDSDRLKDYHELVLHLNALYDEVAGVESRKLAFRRSTNATASRHVVPTFPTGVFYVFVLINIMFLS